MRLFVLCVLACALPCSLAKAPGLSPLAVPAAWGVMQVLRTNGRVGTAASSTAVDLGTMVVGAGEDFFGNAQHTAFIRGSNRALHAWSFDDIGSLTRGMDFTINNTALVVDAGTSIVGGSQDFFHNGNGERTLFTRGGNGALHAWSFDGTGAIITGQDFSSGGTPLIVDTGTLVVGGGEDFFGNGGHTTFARASDDSLSVPDFTASG